MAHGTVVILGSLLVEARALDFHAAEFDWSIRMAETWRQLTEIATREKVVAVLFDATPLGLSWEHALQRIANIAPEAHPVICHEFSDPIDWPRLVEAGAFHSLARPLNAREVRQSLGFIWAAGR